LYSYSATISRVIDGDTVVLDVDLGFKIRHEITARLDGIDAPELRTAEGKLAKVALAGLVGGKTLAVRTVKDRTEKYGRYLLVILLEDGVSTANQWMIDLGHARPYSGGPR
jgi:micrococcal nuclease